MTNTRLVAYALIAIGLVALLSRITGDSGWLWIGLVAAGFLAAYQRERTYAFLVLGAVLMGVAVGILLEGSWHWPGAFLVSLGAGVAAIDLAAPRPNRWPRTVGLGLIALGVVTGLAEAGVLTSSAFAVLLIAAGIALVVLSRRAPAAAPPPWSTPTGTTPTGSAPSKASPSGTSPSGTSPSAAIPTEPTPTKPTPSASTPTGPRPAEPTPTEPTVAGSGPSGAGAEGAQGATPDPTGRGLREALEAWRRDTAEAEGRSEALVISDATLEAIVEVRPQTLEALAEIYGIGPVKLERYGQALLQRTRRG